MTEYWIFHDPGEAQLNSFIRFLVVLLMPIALIAAGAGLLGLGANNDIQALMWIGAGLFLAGVIWGGILILFNSSGSFFD